jgi:hypothetical protein
MRFSLRTLVSRAFDAADWVIIHTQPQRAPGSQMRPGLAHGGRRRARMTIAYRDGCGFVVAERLAKTRGLDGEKQIKNIKYDTIKFVCVAP